MSTRRSTPDASSGYLATASGVTAPEFRDILGGTGAHAHAGRLGMLGQTKAIFDSKGIASWAFQLDGARCQSISPAGVQGAQTRRLILSVAPKVVDGWPATSPDLSPIKNVFSHVERILWTEYKWDDFEGYKRALRACWQRVTGGASGSAYLRRVVGSFEKRRLACIAADGGRIKY